jgi:hypothetical protein
MRYVAQSLARPSSRGWIHSFLLDHAGRLWVATANQGLLRFDHPTAPNPQFRQYGYSDGCGFERWDHDDGRAEGIDRWCARLSPLGRIRLGGGSAAENWQ